MEGVVKLIHEGNPSWCGKDVGCAQCAVSQIRCKHKQNRKVKKSQAYGQTKEDMKVQALKNLKQQAQKTGNAQQQERRKEQLHKNRKEKKKRPENQH